MKAKNVLSIKGIPFRYVLLVLTLLLLTTYFLTGYADNTNLTKKTGLVKDFKYSIDGETGEYKYNITLQDCPDTVYWQKYYIDYAAQIIWRVHRKKLFSITDQIKENDAVTFYYKEEEKTQIFSSGAIGKRSYGLYLDGKTIIDVTKRKYYTFGIGSIATLALLTLILTLVASSSDWIKVSGVKEKGKKIKEFRKLIKNKSISYGKTTLSELLQMGYTVKPNQWKRHDESGTVGNIPMQIP